jgi:hypothetical protein
VQRSAAWHDALKAQLVRCEPEPFFRRVVCREKARWKYCDPDRWNKVPECRMTTQGSN